MDGGLIFGLLLTMFGSLFTILGHAFDEPANAASSTRAPEKKHRALRRIIFPMMATVIGTGFTTWELVEGGKETAATLERNHAIIDSLDKANELHRFALQQQRSNAEATSKSFKESLGQLTAQSESLKVQSAKLGGIGKELTTAVDQGHETLGMIHSEYLGLSSIKLEIDLRFKLPLTSALKEEASNSGPKSIALKEVGVLDREFNYEPELNDTSIFLDSLFYLAQSVVHGIWHLEFTHNHDSTVFGIIGPDSAVTTFSSLTINEAKGVVLYVSAELYITDNSFAAAMYEQEPNLLDLEDTDLTMLSETIEHFLLLDMSPSVSLLGLRLTNPHGYSIDLLSDSFVHMPIAEISEPVYRICLLPDTIQVGPLRGRINKRFK